MAEKRKKNASICLKSEASGTIKLEFFCSDQWEDGPENMVRARMNGKWIDKPDGKDLFLNAQGVSGIISKLLSNGALPPPPIKPTYTKGQCVQLPVGPYDDGLPAMITEQGHIMNPEPIMGMDGRYHVLVHGAQNSFCIMPCDVIKPLHSGKRHKPHK